MLADDLGPGDLTCYGGKPGQTPNLDRMAKEGIRFTKYYTASPICSPSRCGLITGQFPARWRLTSYLQTRAGNAACEQADFLDPKAPTLPRTLKSAGYATAHVGKWHLGGGRDVDAPPKFAAYGYDLGYGTWESPEPHPDITATDWIWSAKDKVKRWDRSRWMVDQTLDFLSKNPDRPCFVNLWLDDPHTPWVPTADDQAVGKKGQTVGKENTPERLAGVLTEMDRQVGRLLDALRDRKSGRPTLVLFLSDNGPLPTFQRQRSAGLRGSKLSLYEGGIRVPCIAWGPGVVPAGLTNETTVLAAVDLFPTLRQALRGRVAGGVQARRRRPERGPAREDADTDEAAFLGVRPQRQVVRLPEGTRPQPERRGARRQLEAAGQRRRCRGRVVRPRGRPQRGEGPRRVPAGRGATARRPREEVARVAAVTAFVGRVESSRLDRSSPKEPRPARERLDLPKPLPGGRGS